MSERPEVMMRPTIKAHLPYAVAMALETIQRDVYEHHLGEGVLHGSSFLLVRGGCALEELEMALAALEEVDETAEASDLTGSEKVVAGRVGEVVPAVRRAVETLRGAFEGGE